MSLEFFLSNVMKYFLHCTNLEYTSRSKVETPSVRIQNSHCEKSLKLIRFSRFSQSVCTVLVSMFSFVFIVT
jgi:hypothetical protein